MFTLGCWVLKSAERDWHPPPTQNPLLLLHLLLLCLLPDLPHYLKQCYQLCILCTGLFRLHVIFALSLMETISDFLLLTCSCYFPRTIKSNICLILKLPSNLVGEKGENKTGTNISLNTVVCKILYQIFLTFIIEGHSNIFFISLIFNGPNSKFMQKENYKQSEVFFFTFPLL